MDKHMTNLMDGIRKMNMEEIDKLHKALRQPIKINSHYTELLERLSKADLDKIRQKLLLQGISQLKKSELIQILKTEIPRGMNLLLKDISDSELSLIKKIIKHHGSLPLTDNMDSVVKDLYYLGIVFSGTLENGKKIVLIPEEINHEIVKLINHTDFNRNRKQMKQIVTLINGILYFYGVMTESGLYKKVTEFMPIEPQLFKDIIENRKNQDILFKRADSFIARIEVENPGEIYREQLKRNDLSYYPLTMKEAMEAGETLTESFSPYDIKLFDYLFNRYEIERAELEGLIAFSKFMLRNTLDTKEVFIFYGKQFRSDNIEDVRYMTGLVMDMYNNTRQWILKGYSPSEIRGNQPIIRRSLDPSPGTGDTTKIIKMSENLLCSCGSGLRYKWCCGREKE